MNAERSGPMILVVGILDDFVYVYNNIVELLADNSICVRVAKKYGAFEFFDCNGCRLVANYDRQWRLRSLTPIESGDPDLILNRVHNCLDYLRRFIKENSDEFKAANMTVDQALAYVPDLSEVPDLPTAAQALLNHFPRKERRTLRALPRTVANSLRSTFQQGCGNPVSCWCEITRVC